MRLRGIPLQLDVSQATKCYTQEDYSELNGAHLVHFLDTFAVTEVYRCEVPL